MGVSGHILGIARVGAIVVDSDCLAIEFVKFSLIILRITRIGFPEICSFEEAELRCRQINCLDRVDETEHMRPLRPEMLSKLLHEGENRRPYHDMIKHIGRRRDAREIARKRSFSSRNRDQLKYIASLRFDRSGKEVPVVVTKQNIGINDGDFFPQIRGDPGSDGRHLSTNVGDTSLKNVPIERPGRDLGSFSRNKIGNLSARQHAAHKRRRRAKTDDYRLRRPCILYRIFR